MKIKHTIQTGLVIFGLGLAALFSCKKDKEIIDPVTGPTSMAEFFKENEVPTQNFSLNSSSGGTITGSQGTVITIPANAFKKSDGSPVTGTVTIEVKEIFEKANMILSDKPTVSNGQILVSGGELYIGAMQNGEEVYLDSEITVSTPTETIDYSMGLFTGVSTDTGFNWVPVNQATPTQDSSFIYDNVFPYSYIFEIDTLGWINCDYFYNDPNPKYDLTTKFSNGPDEVVVYYVFKNINSVIRAYDWDEDFEFTGTQIPQGQSIIIVALGVDGNGKYYMATEEVEMSANLTVSMSMAEVSKDQLMSALDNL